VNVTVFVVDDQDLVREGITALLGLQPGIELVGSARDALRPSRSCPAAGLMWC
jgi:DNA-binding NarL/FixJ family response regulator